MKIRPSAYPHRHPSTQVPTPTPNKWQGQALAR